MSQIWAYEACQDDIPVLYDTEGNLPYDILLWTRQLILLGKTKGHCLWKYAVLLGIAFSSL
jgi:hypothetical protein